MTQITAFCVDDEACERKCCARLIERTQGARCKAVMAGLMAQPMPAGSLHQLRRVLHEMAGGEVVWAS